MGDGWDVSCGMTMCVFSLHIGKGFVFLGFGLYSGLDGVEMKLLGVTDYGARPTVESTKKS